MADPQLATDDMDDVLEKAIRNRFLRSLEFEDMMSRESQIETPFPETFRWLLVDSATDEGNRPSPTPPTKFKEWLESPASEAPYWITGKAASGKSTLMKYICSNQQVKKCLNRWSGEFRLLTCSVYLWNPGSSAQKSQIGLVRKLLHQLLRQRPEPCRIVAPRRHLYFHIAGANSPDPPDWTLDELQDGLMRFISGMAQTDRLVMFIDGLDEYDGNHQSLVSYLNKLHHGRNIKLCVSSRPWNVFSDEFHASPSLVMEIFTKPDIEKYVRTRISESHSFQELRTLYSANVKKLATEIIRRADSVFLWVVLVVGKIITTARDNNDLSEIWRILNSLPDGLGELYGSMRGRLDPAHRKTASVMYQLLFQWKESHTIPFRSTDFWTAVNLRDPTALPKYPTEDDVPAILPLLERRLAGATGGMLQSSVFVGLSGDGLEPTVAHVDFLHRTVYDWLQDVKPEIVEDGPPDYDPDLTLTSVLVSRTNSLLHLPEETSGIQDMHKLVFETARHCNDSPGSRAKLLRIVEQLKLAEQGKAYYFPVRGVLLGYPDSVMLSYLASLWHCAAYLQGRLESSSGTTGLEFPRMARVMPSALWGEARKDIVQDILSLTLFSLTPADEMDVQKLNMRLKTFDALLKSHFAPRRFLRSRLKSQTKASPPHLTEFHKALLALVDGKGLVELTGMPSQGTLDDTSESAGDHVDHPRLLRRATLTGRLRRTVTWFRRY